LYIRALGDYKCTMNRTLSSPLQSITSPLALASYLAWAAVWVSVSGRFGVPGDGFGWPGEVILWAFLGAWLTCLMLESPANRWLELVAVVLLALLSLALLWLGRSGSSPILLILVASMLASHLDQRSAWLALMGLNAAFAGLLHWRWNLPLAFLLPTVAAYGAFQVFAVLVLRYAEQARTMADQLQQTNAHLLATRALLSEAARDQERLRLSRELHDVAGHKLTALKLNLRSLRRRPELADVAELATAEDLSSELLDDLRAVARQLRSHDGIDLTEGIRELARPLPRPELVVDIEPGLRIPKAEQAETLLRVVQEGLTNIARHGQAERAWLTLSRHNGELLLELADNGQWNEPIRPGNGLTGMRERLEELGGSLSVSRAGQGGLKLTARLPLEPQ
jgi:signal transduction histidine kinase